MLFGKIVGGRKVVAASATAERLVADSTPASWVIITAETDNTGVMVVAGSAVVAALATRKGVPLAAGESVTFVVSGLEGIWLDTTVNGDGCTFVYGY